MAPRTSVTAAQRLLDGYVRALRDGGAVETAAPPHDLGFPIARLVAQSLRLAAGLTRARPPAASGPSVAIAEPSLLGAGGHHLEIALATARAFRAMGWDVRVLANRRFHRAPEDATGDGLDPLPAFGASNAEGLYARRFGHTPYAAAFLANAMSYGADLDLAFARWRRPELVVFPTSSIVQIAGAALLRPSFLRPGAVERQAHLVYLDPRSSLFAAESPYGEEAHRTILRMLRPHLRSGRLRIFSDSATVVDSFRAFGAAEAEPIDLPMQAPVAGRAPGAPITVGFLGSLRPEKGAALLPAIIEGVLARVPAARLVVQANVVVPHAALPPIVARLRAIRDPSGRLTLLRRALRSEEYAALLRDVDVLALPYHPGFYREVTSGICLEGLAGGKVMIGPSSGWMAERGREGGAYVGVDTLSAASVVEGIAGAIARFDELSARARAAAPALAARHAPSAFAARLAGLTPRAARTA